jgi:hypothetical protein
MTIKSATGEYTEKGMKCLEKLTFPASETA